MDGKPLRTFDVPATALFLRKCCANEETRYAMRVVQVGRAGDTGFAVATNSKIIVVMEWPAEGPAEDFDMLIPKGVFKRLAEMLPRRSLAIDAAQKSTLRIKTYDTGHMSIGLVVPTDDFVKSITYKTWDQGRFPPWRDLFAKGAELVPLTSGKMFNPSLFATLMRAIERMFADCPTVPTIHVQVCKEPTDGALFVLAEESERNEYCGRRVRGLIMPMSEADCAKRSRKPKTTEGN